MRKPFIKIFQAALRPECRGVVSAKVIFISLKEQESCKKQKEIKQMKVLKSKLFNKHSDSQDTIGEIFSRS